MRFKTEATEDEALILNIVNTMLEEENVNKFVTPITGVCYLHNTVSGNKVRVDGKTVDIYIGDNLVKKSVSGNTFNKLHKNIRAKIEKEMEEIDKTLFTEELRILKGLL